MSLSQWDSKFMTPEEQQQVLDYKSKWGSDPTQRDSIHSFVEGIRGKYGYSGGVDGSQYNPIPVKPTIPTIDKWESPNQGMIDDLYNQVKNPPKFEDPYRDLINQSISDIMNRPKFSYDADNDPAYQAFIQRATRAGDKAYADNLGGMSAMTGGRPNSWAGTVASQARNEYTLQAQEAVIHFEERAYSRYKDETADMYNLVNLLNSQDDKAYSRFRDTIGDTKDLFDMVMKLDDRDFQNYKFMAEQQWKTFDTEYSYYKDALQEKKDKVNAALDRTNLTGFVNNEDSILLGVPTGTLSQGARERAEQMADYVTKQAHDLEQFKLEKEETHKWDLKLLKAKEQIDIAADARRPKGGSGGGSGGSGGGSNDAPVLNKTQLTTKNKIIDDFIGLTKSKGFILKDGIRPDIGFSDKRVALVADFFKDVNQQYETGKFGDPNGEGYYIFTEALKDIQKMPVYNEVVRTPSIVNNDDTGLDF